MLQLLSSANSEQTTDIVIAHSHRCCSIAALALTRRRRCVAACFCFSNCDNRCVCGASHLCASFYSIFSNKRRRIHCNPKKFSCSSILVYWPRSPQHSFCFLTVNSHYPYTKTVYLRARPALVLHCPAPLGVVPKFYPPPVMRASVVILRHVRAFVG